MKQFYILVLTFFITGLGFGQVFITEIADPNNDATARYVELYNAGGTSVDLSTWALRRWTNNNTIPQADKSLSGTIAPNGFIVFAANSTGFGTAFTTFSGTVIQLGTGGPVDGNGDDNTALINNLNVIVDIFGVPGEDGSNTCHEFEDGRVERIATVTTGNATWNESEWNVWADTTVSGCTSHTNDPQDAPADFDPGEWIGEATSTNPTIAFDATTSSETETNASFSVNIPVTVTNYSGTQIDVSVAVSGGTAEIADYTLNTTSLSFTANGTQNISVDINPDLDDFDDETITITLTETSSVTDLDISSNTHTINVTEDESPSSIGFDAASSSETETDATFTSANIPITVSNYSGTQIDIDVSVTGGTAEAGDYTFTSPTSLSFTGDGSQNITVDINPDVDDFDDETIIFTMIETSSVTGLVILQSIHTVTVFEDEAAPIPTAGSVIITEVLDSSVGFNNDYLELFNNSSETVSLSSSKLIRMSSIGTFEYAYDFGVDESTASADLIIPAYGFMIIARGSSRSDYNTAYSITLPVSVSFNGGNSNLFFGSGRRWSLKTGGTANTDDGALIDDTLTGVGSSKDYRNIFTDTFVSGSDSDGTPGELEYLLYLSGAWVNSVAMDGTTGAIDAYFYDDFSISSNAEANDIGINTGNSLMINALNSLNVNGTITNNGTITLNSTSSRYASLIANSVVGGTVTYNRWVDSDTNGRDLIAPPVSGQAFSAFYTANSANLVTSGSDVLFGPFDNDTNPAEYVIYSNTEGATLDAGTGYRTATDSGSTLTFTGTVETDDLTGLDAIAISDDTWNYGSWNLIGNPYPSYLSFKDFYDLILDDANANANNQLDPSYSGVYGYNSDTSVWTIWDFNNNYATDLIAPGQGFFVKAKSGGGAAEFTTSMRRTGTTDDFITNNRLNAVNVALAQLVLTNGTNSFSTNIYFREGNTLGLDPGYDTGTYGGSANGIFTNLVEENIGVPMANQSVPYTAMNDVVIPLGINAIQGEQISIGLNNTSTIPENINVYLEDIITNTWTLLNTGDYILTPTVDLSGTGRFFLRFTSSTLSVDDSVLNGLQMFTDQSSKSIVVKGLLQDTTSITIYDIQGREVLQQLLDSSSTTNNIDASSLSTGIYVAHLNNRTQHKTQKIILK